MLAVLVLLLRMAGFVKFRWATMCSRAQVSGSWNPSRIRPVYCLTLGQFSGAKLAHARHVKLNPARMLIPQIVLDKDTVSLGAHGDYEAR